VQYGKSHLPPICHVTDTFLELSDVALGILFVPFTMDIGGDELLTDLLERFARVSNSFTERLEFLALLSQCFISAVDLRLHVSKCGRDVALGVCELRSELGIGFADVGLDIGQADSGVLLVPLVTKCFCGVSCFCLLEELIGSIQRLLSGDEMSLHLVEFPSHFSLLFGSGRKRLGCRRQFTLNAVKVFTKSSELGLNVMKLPGLGHERGIGGIDVLLSFSAECKPRLKITAGLVDAVVEGEKPSTCFTLLAFTLSANLGQFRPGLIGIRRRLFEGCGCSRETLGCIVEAGREVLELLVKNARLFLLSGDLFFDGTELR
jgi:hypothetical protein